MPRYTLLDDKKLTELIHDPHSEVSTYERSMALELQQYRRLYGPLGPEWLSSEDEGSQPFIDPVTGSRTRDLTGDSW